MFLDSLYSSHDTKYSFLCAKPRLVIVPPSTSDQKQRTPAFAMLRTQLHLRHATSGPAMLLPPDKSEDNAIV